MAASRETTASRYFFDDVAVDCHDFSVAKDKQQKVLTPRAFDVLRYLIENRGRVVEKAELFEQVWKERFVSDNALTRTVADIRQALGDSATAPRYIETVPKRGYRFIAVININTEQEVGRPEEGLSATPVLSEAAEEPRPTAANPAAAVRAAGRRRPSNSLNRRKLFLIAIVISALTVGALAAYRLAGRNAPTNSVAVMPIVNVSRDPEAEYLVDGLTESIISNLSRVSGLKVMSRNSVFRYKGKEVDPRAVGHELGVGALLLTRLELRGNNLVIGLELVDTQDNHQLWGQQLNRKLTDMAGLPGEIEQLIVEKLQLPLTPQEKQLLAKNPANSAEVYQLYLKGRYLLETLDPVKARQSMEYFQQAIKLDPNYAPAYVGLAEYYFSLGTKSGNRPQESMLLAKAATARALELDETLAEAHSTRGLIFDFYDWDWAAAEKEMRRALELNPTSDLVRHDLAIHLALQGRADESLAESKKALALDPSNVRLNLNVGWILYSTRQYEQALTHFQQMIATGVYLPGSYSWVAQIYAAQGRYEQAVEMDLKYRILSRITPQEEAALRAANATSGWKGYLQKVLEQRKEAAARRYVEPYVFAILYTHLGKKEQALRWLEKAYQEKSTFMTRLNRDPVFDSLRSEPRFQGIIQRMGLPAVN